MVQSNSTGSGDNGVRFVKMQGAGNDYVYISPLGPHATPLPDDPGLLAQQISDRHFGVGGDGLVMILPSDVADFRMRMFNADGSEAQMCGNAIRCVARYIHDYGLSDANPLKIETLAGIRTVELKKSGNAVTGARVDMGSPVLVPAAIPVDFPGDDPMISREVTEGDSVYRITAVSMGNPHGVVFTEEITDTLVTCIGPLLEKNAVWPEKANIEFVKVKSRDAVDMRVWERGSGETMACGTGACATVVACVLNGLTGRRVTVSLPGGELEVNWSEEDGHVYLTGPADIVCEGTYFRQS